jgi:formylglycine-generating enzyme required for sulfatase activity
MSFNANKFGLYDLGGNVWEYCEDWYNAAQKQRVLRGASFYDEKRGFIIASSRAYPTQNSRLDRNGFRVVLELPATSTASSVPTPTPARQASAPGNPTPASSLASATKDRPFVNSLGMKFVPVPGTKVLFSIWHTRVQDYDKFLLETGRTYKAPDYEHGPTHPAMNIKWEDAKAFCDWLSAKERLEYRLPRDAEWSTAAGDTVYPWGNDAAVPKGFGNFGRRHGAESFDHITPVGSFPPDKHGLFDMAGNAFQWCEDIYDPSLNEPFTLEQFPSLKMAKPDDGSVWHVTRGSSWGFGAKVGLRTSFRQHSAAGTGFRCVVVMGSTAAPASATLAPP